MNSPIGVRAEHALASEFACFRAGRRVLYIRSALKPQAGAILAHLTALAEQRRPGAGNRQSAYALEIDGAPAMIARAERRGGAMRFILADLYIGLDPRSVRELKVTLEARQRGIPVAEPMGAMVDWLGPLLYRGFFVTRAMTGMTLWELLRTDDDPLVRAHVIENARNAIDIMHAQGLYHADLNLTNLFVTKAGESFAVIVLDLDKARLFDRPLGKGLRRRNLRRLIRSARKLDPQQRYLDSAALRILAGA